MLNGAQPPPRCAPMAFSTPTGRAALSTRLLARHFAARRLATQRLATSEYVACHFKARRSTDRRLVARRPAARWFTWREAQRCAARRLAIHWGIPDSSRRDSSAPLPLKHSARVGAAHSPVAATAMLNGAQPPPRCAPMAFSTPTDRAALSTRLSGSNSSAIKQQPQRRRGRFVQ